MAEMDVIALKLHKDAGMVPAMRSDEWASFLADVSRRGVQEPLVVQEGGTVLDGRSRLEAAKVSKIVRVPVRMVNLSAGEQVEFMIRAAILRRHLNDSQRAMLGEELKSTFAAEAKERQVAAGKEHGKGHPKVPVILPEANRGDARDKAAAAVQVSGKSIDFAAKVKANGTPALVAAVKAGHVPVSAAAKLAALPEPKQIAAVSGGKPAIREAIKVKPKKVPISETFYEALSDIRARLSGIRDQYGGVKGMFESKLWQECDIAPVIQMTGMLADLLAKMHKDMLDYEAKHKKA